MKWPRFRFARQVTLPAPSDSRPVAGDGWLHATTPEELLGVHRKLLTGLRLESGYNPTDYQFLIHQVLVSFATYVHCLPATRSLHHSDEGGLLRLGLETAFFAFRRADGRISQGVSSTEQRNSLDRAWRYAAFLAGLVRRIGRAATLVSVYSPDGRVRWNPLEQGLYSWLWGNRLKQYGLRWRTQEAAGDESDWGLWLCARVVPKTSLDLLHSASPAIVESLIDVLGGSHDNNLYEVVYAAEQAAIGNSLVAPGKSANVRERESQAHLFVIDTIRQLVSRQHGCNAPGSCIWITRQGVYLVWSRVVDYVRKCAASAPCGLPGDSEALARILVLHDVLHADSDGVSPSYFEFSVVTDSATSLQLRAVRVRDSSLFGIATDGIAPAEVRQAADGRLELWCGAVTRGDSGKKETQVAVPTASRRSDPDTQHETKWHAATTTPSMPLPCLPDAARQTGKTAHGGGGETPVPDGSRSVNPSARPRAAALDDERETQTVRASPPPTAAASPADGDAYRALSRYGRLGEVLRNIAEDHTAGRLDGLVIEHPAGIAVAYPEVIEGRMPCDEFLEQSHAQNLILPDPGNPARLIWNGDEAQAEPGRFIVLGPRVARFFCVRAGQGALGPARSPGCEISGAGTDGP